MIRSTKVSLKFCNKGKADCIRQFIGEYRRVVVEFIDLFWERDKLPKFISSEIYKQVDTWLIGRARQAAAQQACGIVRGTRAKQERRKHVLAKLEKDGLLTQAKRLKKVIDSQALSKPDVKNVCPQLDSRFVKIELSSTNSYDGWVTLGIIGKGKMLAVPFRKTAHLNKLALAGKLKPTILLSNKSMQLVFELPEATPRTSGTTIGIDIGQNTLIACSNQHMSKPNNHGHDLNSITTILCRKKKGSLGFRKAQEHRKNYINWAINQLNLSEVREIRIENMKHVRRNKRTSRRLGHWTYTDIFSKLERRCEELGVQVTRISPTYTSRRCSKCGWTRRANRKGKLFVCGQCGLRIDSDYNASLNIGSIGLKPFGFNRRRENDIKSGFYWHSLGEDPIVPLVQKT